jgi:hypothetical protein
MSYALIIKLKEAKSSGSDPRPLVEEWLHSNYRSTRWALLSLIGVMFLLTLLVGSAVAALAMQSDAEGIPVLSSLARMDKDDLSTLIGILIASIAPLAVVLMQIRNGRHKNFAALLLMTAGCEVAEAVKVMVDGKGGKGQMLVEIVSSVFGAA